MSLINCNISKFYEYVPFLSRCAHLILTVKHFFTALNNIRRTWTRHW